MDLFPRARRALLTAYADTDAAIAAINVVDVDHYLLKPWEPPEEKLYPVVDAMIESYEAAPDREVDRDQGDRAPVVGPVVRGARLPGPQRRAVPLVRLRRARGRAAAGGRRARRGAAAGRRHDRTATTLVAPSTAELAAAVGLSTIPATDFYDLVVVGGGPAGLGAAVYGASEGLRTLLVERQATGGQAGPVVADRELPRLPRRRVRRAAHRPGPPAGDQVRRRDPHRAGRHRPARRRRRARSSRFGDGTEVRAHVVIVATGVSYRDLEAPGCSRPHRPRRVLRLGRDRGRRLRRATTSTSSAGPTPPARRRCSSPAWPSR